MHPNVVLVLALTPDDLARKTWRAIIDNERLESPDDYIEICGKEYHHKVMEDDYNESWQIQAKEGDIIIFDMVTYGYGEVIEWADLETQKKDLEEWAKATCEKCHCAYRIFVTANYW